MRSISRRSRLDRNGLSASSASASASSRSNSISTGGASRFASCLSLVLSDLCSQDTRPLDDPLTVAVASSSLFGTFFLTHQTPCSFLIIDMLTRIVDTTALYHCGRLNLLGGLIFQEYREL